MQGVLRTSISINKTIMDPLLPNQTISTTQYRYIESRILMSKWMREGRVLRPPTKCPNKDISMGRVDRILTLKLLFTSRARLSLTKRVSCHFKVSTLPTLLVCHNLLCIMDLILNKAHQCTIKCLRSGQRRITWWVPQVSTQGASTAFKGGNTAATLELLS